MCLKPFSSYMARFARIDSQIRANRLILANRFSVPDLNPLFCESPFGGLKIANRSFEAIRAKFAANRLHVMKIGFCLRIDSRESIYANRPDSRCESPGHLSFSFVKRVEKVGPTFSCHPGRKHCRPIFVLHGE